MKRLHFNPASPASKARSTSSGVVFLRMALLAVMVLLFSPGHASAQIDQGGIAGSAKDSSGALIPKATVTITSNDTGLQFHVTTDEKGAYALQPLKVGAYKVECTAAGFDTYSLSQVQVNANATTKADLTLSLGNAKDYVIVNAEEKPVLQTEDASVGDTFSSKEVSSLPIPDRDYVFLAQLSPGVVADQNNSAVGTGAFSANGVRSQQNNFLLDGVDNNSPAFDNLSGAQYVILTVPEGINQVRIQTGDYSPELGRSGGAVLNVISKSGTRQFKGEAWLYYRNQALNAKPDFAYITPPYTNMDTGIALGGSITKKLFYFADTRQWRISSSTPTYFTIPTALARTGNFTEYAAATNGVSYSLYEPPNPLQAAPGYPTQPLQCNGQPDILCPSQIDTVAENLLSMFPLPNIAGAAIGQPNYIENINTIKNDNTNSVRFDLNLGKRDQAYVRVAYTRIITRTQNPFGSILGGGSEQNVVGVGFVASETHIFTSRLLNEFRLGFNYGAQRSEQLDNIPGIDNTLGIGGIPILAGDFGGGIPGFSISGIGSSGTSGASISTLQGTTSFGSLTYPSQLEGQNAPQLLDNLSIVLRNHSIRMGVTLQELRIYEEAGRETRGLYTYNGNFTSYKGQGGGVGLADFLTDNMYEAQHSVGVNNSLVAGHDLRWSNGGYIQDDWRAAPTITFNMGIRWDYFSPPVEHNNHQALFQQLSPSEPNIINGPGYGSYTFPYALRDTPISTLLGPFASLFAQNNIAVGFSNNESGVVGTYSNFAPRLGMAFQVTPSTVIRGGFGLYFGGLENLGFNGNLAQNYPYEQELAYTSPSCLATSCGNAGVTLETGFSGATVTPSLALRGGQQNPKTPYVETFNLNIQREFLQLFTAQVGYVGTLGRHLQLFGPGTNTPAALYPTGSAYANWTTFPGFGGVEDLENIGGSSYNSLQVVVTARPSRGLTASANYTYSHSLDDALVPQEANGFVYTYRGPDIFGISPDYSNSNFDVRQRATGRAVYELPFGYGHRYMNRKGWLDTAFGGWRLSPTIQYQTGSPFSITSNTTTVSGGQAHPTIISNPNAGGGMPNSTNPAITCPKQVHTRTNWYNPCAFANPPGTSAIPAPAAGQPYVNGVNYITGTQALKFLGGKLYSVYGPGFSQINASLAKTFPLPRQYNLQFRWDVYNVTNTPELGNPTDKTDDNTGGQITSVRGGPIGGRYMQLSGRFFF